MIVMVKMKNVVQRKSGYQFRMRVPKDCTEDLGKQWVYEALKTHDALEALPRADKLTAHWSKKFEAARNSKSSDKPQLPNPLAETAQGPSEEVEAFRDELLERMNKNLPSVFDDTDEDELRVISERYSEQITAVLRPMANEHLILPELGMEEPWVPHKNKRTNRLLQRVVVEIIQMMKNAIAEDLGEELSDRSDAKAPNHSGQKTNLSTPNANSEEEHDIIEVTELMLSATKRVKRGEDSIRADAHALKEWCGKRDIATYTKGDLVDYVQNCLPYIPHHRSTKKVYNDLSLRECVELTKGDQNKYEPISHTTCKNRLINLCTIFNYAKDQLGLVQINPASKIEIPKVRTSGNLPKGFTETELKALWGAIQTVPDERPKYPSCYWVPLLCLYHGFRLNEAASLFLKDLYEDAEGVFVIDVNADGPNKSVKTKSSVRVIPVHPFILNTLKFRDYVDGLKEERKEGVLFPELVYSQGHGYGRRLSKWLSEWKKTWLPTESHHKHFHDFRHTFSQQAQNQAKMSDRCSQEITGHAIAGVSAVHLGYSGRLKPTAMLEELEKLEYGWERPKPKPKTNRAKKAKRKRQKRSKK